MNTMPTDDWAQDEDFWQVASRPAYQADQTAATRRTEDTGETPRLPLGQPATEPRWFKLFLFH